MRDYSGLTRGQLEARLDAAEDVAVLFAWCPVQHNQRSDAAFEAWRVWEAIGGDSSRKGNPHLTDEVIADLSARRQETRTRTIAALTAHPEEEQ